MKKILTFSLVSLFLFSVMAVPGFNQTVDDILARMIEAQGGKEAIAGIKDMTLKGSADLVQQGLSGTLTVFKKEPDKRRVDFEVMGMIITQAYDGRIAWGTNPQTGSTEKMSEDQAKEQKRQAMPLVSILYPEKYGLVFTYKGKEKIEEEEYFLLEETYPDGFKVTFYIDTGTYLINTTKAKVSGPGGVEVEVEQVMSDFKKVNGIIMAHTITTYQEGEEYMTIALDEINFNTGLEDSLFEMSE